MELKCAVQQYAWGTVGSTSQVAKFAPKACDDFALSEKAPYAGDFRGVLCI